MLQGLGPTNPKDGARLRTPDSRLQTLGLKEPKEATVRLDLRRKEKKAVQNKAQTAM